MTPYSLVCQDQCFGKPYHLHLHFHPKKEAASSFEILVTTYRTTQYHYPDDHNMNLHHKSRNLVNLPVLLKSGCLVLRITPAEVNVKAIMKAGGYTNSYKCIVEKLRVQSGNGMS